VGRRIREKLEECMMNIEAVGPGQLGFQLKGQLREYLEGENEDLKKGIEAVRLSINIRNANDYLN